jgi:hypothetical protein
MESLVKDTVTKHEGPAVPEWVPPGHPCRWTEAEIENYDRLCEPMPAALFKAIDDQVYTRPCTNSECDMALMQEEPEGDVQEEDEPVTTSYEVQQRFQAEFNPNAFLPEGHPDDWDKDGWAFYTEQQEKLPADLAKLVDEVAWARLDTIVPKDEDVLGDYVSDEEFEEAQADLVIQAMDEGKDVWDMTAEEYEAFQGYLQADVKGTSKVTSLPAPGTPKPSQGKLAPLPGAPCKKGCFGPGSTEKETYKTHLDGCPQHPEYTTAKWGKDFLDSGKSWGSSYVSCKHDRQVFKLDNELSIRASAYRDVKYKLSEDVDVGVYLYDSWAVGVLTSPGLHVPWGKEQTTLQVMLDWPDFGIPDLDFIPMVDIVAWMLEQMAAGVRMETACMGGHGRTGTMLACLLVAQGVTPGKAMERVRADHCKKAIENTKQGEFVAAFYKLFHGNESWRKSKPERTLFDKQVQEGHKNYSTGSSSSGTSSFNSEKPLWDEKLHAWTRHTYSLGFAWSKEAKLYTSTTYTPEGGDNKL